MADGAEGFKNEMEGCIHTLKNGYQKASAREFIHMLHQSTAIWKTMGENYVLPDDVVRDKISAKVEDGILTITMPKTEPKEKCTQNESIL